MKQMIMTADDYGMSEAVDTGILELIEKGRLTATSCLTLSPRWKRAAQHITPEIRAKADIGLHLDFTEYAQALRLPLWQLILKSHAKLLPKKALRLAINAQLDLFEEALEGPPDYVDGHLHVHQLPQIRDVLIEELCFRYGKNMPWIRVANPPIRDGWKAFLIGLLGASPMREQLGVLGIRHTTKLLGIYQFNLTKDEYINRLDRWLGFSSRKKQCVAFMSHPAKQLKSQPSVDPHFLSRAIEYQIFEDVSFKMQLEKHQIVLVRGDALTLNEAV